MPPNNLALKRALQVNRVLVLHLRKATKAGVMEWWEENERPTTNAELRAEAARE